MIGRAVARAIAVAGVALVAVPIFAQDDPGSTIELAPERAVAQVAPVETALEGMPPLPPLAIETAALTADLPVVAAATSVVPLPALSRDALTTGAVVQPEQQVYFNATLGGGSVNTVLGNINLFRFGEGPEFRLGYDHRGTDGFNFNQPGTGFFRQDNGLEAWLRLGGDEPVELEIEGAYADRRFGLQRQPVFYAAETRRVTTSAVVTARPESRLTARGGIVFDDARRVLAAADSDGDSPQESFSSVGVDLVGGAEWPRFSLTVHGDVLRSWDSGTAIRPLTSLGMALALEGVPFTGLTLRADGGARYRFGDGAAFPLSAGIEAALGDRLRVDLSGGSRVAEPDFASLWDQFPVATLVESVTGRPLPGNTVFVRGEVELAVVPGLLRIDTAGEWRDESDRLVVDGYDPTSGRYPVSFGDSEATDVSATVNLSPTGWLTVRAGWDGRLAGRETGTPWHVGHAVANLTFGRVEATAEASVPLGNRVAGPRVDGDVRVDLGRDVQLSVFGEDLIGPFDDRGRTPRGRIPGDSDPFVTPGFQIGAAVRVSF